MGRSRGSQAALVMVRRRRIKTRRRRLGKRMAGGDLGDVVGG